MTLDGCSWPDPTTPSSPHYTELNKLTLTIDRPELSPEDIQKLQAAIHNNPAAD